MLTDLGQIQFQQLHSDATPKKVSHLSKPNQSSSSQEQSIKYVNNINEYLSRWTTSHKSISHLILPKIEAKPGSKSDLYQHLNFKPVTEKSLVFKWIWVDVRAHYLKSGISWLSKKSNLYQIYSNNNIKRPSPSSVSFPPSDTS